MGAITQGERRGSIIAPPPAGYGDGRPPGDSGSSFPISKAHLATWILLTAVTMLFGGLSSAYIVLRGVPEWQNITMPRLLWANTVVLFASSLAIEFARGAVRRNKPGAVKQWLAVSGLLGVGFLIGQFAVWRQLVQAGVYLQTNLHSSFFYVLTGIHALHLAGGIGGLAVVLHKAFTNRLTATEHEPLKVWGLYWHFMDFVWIYCFVMLLLA
jgi:cytochrome c oxidase subunit III